MIFNRNKNKNKMVDVRELQKRGVVRIPKKEIKIPATSEGFVELSDTTPNSKLQTPNPPKSNSDFFGFMDKPTEPQPETFSTESDGYNKREVDQKVTDLDNKIYKLEQRIELLEKKLDVNQSSNPAAGVMGW